MSDGVSLLDWIAVGLLFVDREEPATMSEMHRTLALRIKTDMANNWRIIQRIRVALQLSLIVLLLEILAWLVSIGASS